MTSLPQLCLLSVSLFGFRPFSMSSCHLFLSLFLQNTILLVITWNNISSACVCRFFPLVPSTFHAAFRACTSVSTLYELWPIFDLSSHGRVCVLFTQTCTERVVLLLSMNQQLSALVGILANTSERTRSVEPFILPDRMFAPILSSFTVTPPRINMWINCN